MKLDNVIDQTPLSIVSIGLSVEEAEEVVYRLQRMLEQRAYGTADHEHVSSPDYQTEITIWIEPPSEVE